MRLHLNATIPSEDLTQQLLFSSSKPIGNSSLPWPEHSAAQIFPGGSFRSDVAIARRLAYLESRTHRSEVQELLRLENNFAPLTKEQRSNLEAAGSEKAVFLITGQQPGLFGGPILWLYKALTCAAMAREWSVKLSRPVIPIFWVAGDDADLQECNHLELLDLNAALVSAPLSLSFPNQSRPMPVGERPLDPDAVTALLARLAPIWHAETQDTLRRCYSATSTLTSGFLKLAQSQLGMDGVLFIDGYSPNLRARSKPVLEKAIENWKEFQAALLKGTEAAEAAGIKTQVSLRSGVVHAFVLRNGERQRLFAEPIEKNQDRIYTPEQPGINLRPNLASLELTHDVFTRPLVADAIFPVLGHVLGPAELRYFAQMSNLFMDTTGDMPLLHPRMTATVAPIQALVDFQTENLKSIDLAKLGPSGLRSRLKANNWKSHPAAAALSPKAGEEWVHQLRAIYGQHFTGRGVMLAFEKNLSRAWTQYLQSLEHMAYKASEPLHAKLFDHLRWLGGGKGQDRHLNFASLFNVLGSQGMQNLRQVLDPKNPDLQWITFDSQSS